MKAIKKISTISGFISGILIALIWAMMILHYFNRHMQPLNREEEGVLAKSGLPNELIQILGGMAE